MTASERQKRIELFIEFSNQSAAGREGVDILYGIIEKYDLPKHADREFILDCLIAYYIIEEEYERCEVLKKYKDDKDRKKRITIGKLTLQDFYELSAAGYEISDDIKRKAYIKFGKQINTLLIDISKGLNG